MAEILDFMAYLESEDFSQMDAAQLHICLERIRKQIVALDLEEPENMESEAYEIWGERHEVLEDLEDEILDYLDELE